jgi:hypothetical protein
VHFLWENYDSAADRNLIGAVNTLHGIVMGGTRVDAKKGGIKDLSADDVKGLMIAASPDPTAARGMYLINEFACTLDKVESITIALKQDTLYTGVYTTYARSYTSDADAYNARSVATLTWKTDLSAALLDAKYSSTLSGGVRRVTPNGDAMSTFGGPILLVRTWLPTPSVFVDSGPIFDQDYQLEVYYERAPGQLIHVYPLWRHMSIPAAGLTTDDDSVVNLITNDLQSWDDQTARLCAM